MAAWSSARLAAACWEADGLYVATASAGTQESVAFLEGAYRTGLPFANPRLFPWALANSPTGAIGRALGVRGPTYTLLGGAEAVTAAIEHALDDLAAGRVTAAVIVAVDVGHVDLRLAALLADADTGAVVAGGVEAQRRRSAGVGTPDADAASALADILDHLEW